MESEAADESEDSILVAVASHPEWQRFDSLVQARDSTLHRLVQDVAALDSVSASIVGAWWAEGGPPPEEAMDALVRSALRRLGDSTHVAGSVPAELLARMMVLRAVDTP